MRTTRISLDGSPWVTATAALSVTPPTIVAFDPSRLPGFRADIYASLYGLEAMAASAAETQGHQVRIEREGAFEFTNSTGGQEDES